MNMVFNKNNTKKLIKASHTNQGMTLTRLNWLLENKDTFCGCIYKGWFNNANFLVIKIENEYKLIYSTIKKIYIYLIENIEQFLEFINVEELYASEHKALKEQIEEIKKLPSSGVIIIQNKKLFLYDFLFRGKH